MNKTEALQYLDSQQDFLFHTSDSIWDNPETDYHEEKSSAILKNALTGVQPRSMAASDK